MNEVLSIAYHVPRLRSPVRSVVGADLGLRTGTRRSFCKPPSSQIPEMPTERRTP